MANRWFTQFFGSLHKKPVQLDCNFVVDQTNQNGLGIRSLKGPGIANVFMNTTASFVGTSHTTNVIDSIVGGTASLVVGSVVSGTDIAAGTTIASITSGSAITLSQATAGSHSGQTINVVAAGSPNPAPGLIFVNLQDNFNRYFFGTSGFVSPLTGTSISISTGSSLTVGNAYVITAVGSSTAANWVAVGVPIGITAAPGVAFIASATSGSGSGTVQAASNSGILEIEVVGDPNTTITSSAATVLGVSSGAYIISQCLSVGTIAFTGNTHTSTTIDGISPGTAGLVVGHGISGTGIPLGTTIASIVSSSSITISAAATGTVSGVAFTSGGQILTQPANNTVIGLTFYMSNSVITVQGE